MLTKIEKYKKYFAFEGKSSRSEYWGTYLIGCLLSIGAGILSLLLFVLSSPFTLILIGFVGWAISLTVLCVGVVLSVWLCAATAIRRCNDAGISPWFVLTLLLPPPIGTIPFIVFGCLPSEKKIDEHQY
jgi:uncharacterized membrane protein YhaH (DUF805 family)